MAWSALPVPLQFPDPGLGGFRAGFGIGGAGFGGFRTGLFLFEGGDVLPGLRVVPAQLSVEKIAKLICGFELGVWVAQRAGLLPALPPGASGPHVYLAPGQHHAPAVLLDA